MRREPGYAEGPSMMPRTAWRSPPGRMMAIAFALSLGMAPQEARTQSVSALVSACGAADGTAARECAEAGVVALRNLDLAVLSTAGGAEAPGSASTLGMRTFQDSPRLTTWLRTGFARASVPRISGEHDREAEFLLPSLRAGVAAAVFDGFRPVPTIWGLLSLDLLASGGVSLFPASQGYLGAVTSYGIGARVGILRESFTVPGITVSARRSYIESVRFGGDVGTPLVSTAPRATSLRASLGKDLVAIGAILGVGLDLYEADVELSVDAGRAEGSVTGSRLLYFGGVGLNFLFVQVSAEGGLASELEDVPAYEPARSRAGTVFVNLAIRIVI